jgi:hypothetical protein
MKHNDRTFAQDMRYGGAYWVDIAKELNETIGRSLHLINQAGPP